MLSYRHSFHAGNHADVLKHIVLMLILENLKLKEKGFFLFGYALWRGALSFIFKRIKKNGGI